MQRGCGQDAREVLTTHRNSAYNMKGGHSRRGIVLRRASAERPPQDVPLPEIRTEWRVEVGFEFNRVRAEILVAEHNFGAIVTNILFATENRENVRHGATAATVLGLYLDQYKVEYTYCLMKSGMGVDSVYVRSPKRADTLLFVVAIATLISSIIHALLRRSGTCPFPTVKMAAEKFQHVLFVFYRSTGDFTVVGPEGSADLVFAYIDGIGSDTSVLFE